MLMILLGDLSGVLHSALHHRHQNINWGNMFWAEQFHRLVESLPNILLWHLMLVFHLICHPYVFICMQQMVKVHTDMIK